MRKAFQAAAVGAVLSLATYFGAAAVGDGILHTVIIGAGISLTCLLAAAQKLDSATSGTPNGGPAAVLGGAALGLIGAFLLNQPSTVEKKVELQGDSCQSAQIVRDGSARLILPPGCSLK